MNSFDASLAERLHGMVDGEFDATPPVGRVLGRAHAAGRRRHAARLTGASLAVLAAGAVIGGIATTPWATHPKGTARSSTVAQTPLLRLEAAVTASGSTSYNITVTAHSKSTPGAKDQ